VLRHQQGQGRDTLREVSKAQRRSVALNLPVYRGRYPDRAEAMARAYFPGAYTVAKIGAHFGVHYMTVSRAVKAFEQRKDNDQPT
jgi:putative transposase